MLNKCFQFLSAIASAAVVSLSISQLAVNGQIENKPSLKCTIDTISVAAQSRKSYPNGTLIVSFTNKGKDPRSIIFYAAKPCYQPSEGLLVVAKPYADTKYSTITYCWSNKVLGTSVTRISKIGSHEMNLQSGQRERIAIPIDVPKVPGLYDLNIKFSNKNIEKEFVRLSSFVPTDFLFLELSDVTKVQIK